MGRFLFWKKKFHPHILPPFDKNGDICVGQWTKILLKYNEVLWRSNLRKCESLFKKIQII